MIDIRRSGGSVPGKFPNRIADSAPIAMVTGRRMWNGETPARSAARSEEHTSELQSLMRISYAVFCLKKKTKIITKKKNACVAKINNTEHIPTQQTHIKQYINTIIK